MTRLLVLAALGVASASLVACDGGGATSTCPTGAVCGDSGSADAALGFSDGGTPVGDGAGGGGDGSVNCQGTQTACGASCCNSDQVCINSKCEALGPQCGPLRPCPAGFFCDKAINRCTPGARKCEYRPPVAQFAPKLEWAWTGSKLASAWNQVMMAPMVANLTDDNGDGKIDENDIPDIIFHTFRGSNYRSEGVLRAISGDGSGDHFAVTSHYTHPGTEVAIGDIDGDGKPEIVACRSGGGTIAFEHDGKFKWQSDVGCNAPAIADLDGDGKVEVVVCYSALEGGSGKTKFTAKTGCTYTTVVDIDEDGKLEIVGGNAVIEHDGQVKWHDTSRPDGYPAVADLDGDGKPEIVTASSSDHSLRAYHADGTKYWGPVDTNQGRATAGDKCNGCGGGPPTIADFDGDGKPEIAAAGGWGYVVFEHDGKPKWFKATKDLSSRVTGSSVFDFEGDGRAEVVYADEHELRIYDGQTGKVLFNICNTSGTLREYPVIVDVDNDDHAEIVVANNNYNFKTCADNSASSTGIRVYGDTKNNWVRTRRIWNQHTYHVTNINEDGSVPRVPDRNWDNPALNNFRQNVQPGGLFDAPDLLGSAQTPKCGSSIEVKVEVKNQGAARVTPGVSVALYLVPGGSQVNQLLGTEKTQTTINPGQSETVTFKVKTPAGLANQQIKLLAVVDDDGTSAGTVNECDEKNNQIDAGTTTCKSIN